MKPTLVKIRTVCITRLKIDDTPSDVEVRNDPVLKRFRENDYNCSYLNARNLGGEGLINLNCVAELIPFKAPFIVNDASDYSKAKLDIRMAYILRRMNGQNLGLNGTDYSSTIDEASAKKIMSLCEIV